MGEHKPNHTSNREAQHGKRASGSLSTNCLLRGCRDSCYESMLSTRLCPLATVANGGGVIVAMVASTSSLVSASRRICKLESCVSMHECGRCCIAKRFRVGGPPR